MEYEGTIDIGNPSLLELDNLLNTATGEHENSSNVLVTLKDALGADVPTAIDVPMNYVAGTRGSYTGTLPALDLTEGEIYTAVVTSAATASQGLWNHRLLAVVRRSD